jgi:NADPH-dependent ferric siderophore reductase
VSESIPSPAPEAAAPRKRTPPRLVDVARIEVLSPVMRRITLAGPALAGFQVPLPAAYIKLIFPEPGQTEAIAPTPDGPRSPWMRTYTPRRFDADKLELDVDFVLHGEGPASSWAEQARVGQSLYLMGPGPGYKIDLTAPSHWLVGDDSALPAFETILETLPPATPVKLLVEVVDKREERPLPGAALQDIRWLARGSDNSIAGRTLEDALRTMAPPEAGARIYVACEAMAMRRIRQLLIDELKVPRSQVIGRGYWKLGAVNHPDHPYGDEA